MRDKSKEQLLAQSWDASTAHRTVRYAHSLFVVLWLSSVFLNLHPNYSYDVYTNLKNDMKLCGNLSVLLHLYETHEHMNSNFDKYQYPFCTCALTPSGKTANLAWNVFSVNHSHFRQNSGHSGKIHTWCQHILHGNKSGQNSWMRSLIKWTVCM